MKKIHINQNGNVLFLVLVGVLLFAALSFAVMSSLDGTTSIDDEEAKLYATRIIQSTGQLKTKVNRMYMLGRHDQIQFTKDAYNASGTCYDGGQTPYTCKTIGIFHASTGMPYLRPDDDNYDGTYWDRWYWYSQRLYIDGVDLGTSAPDEFLILPYLRDEVCNAINNELNGEDLQNAAYITNSDSPDVSWNDGLETGTIYAISQGDFNSLNLPYVPGCFYESFYENMFVTVLRKE